VTYACRLTHVRSMPPHNTRPLISPNRLCLPSRVRFACSQHRPHDAQARLTCPASFDPPTHLTLSTPLTHTRPIAAPHLFLPGLLCSLWGYLKKKKPVPRPLPVRPWTATPPLDSEGQIRPSNCFKGTQELGCGSSPHLASEDLQSSTNSRSS
jgi:hypothetical protein